MTYYLLILTLVIWIRWVLGIKSTPGVLNCGIFGGGFKGPLDPLIIQNLKILGMFNQSRGEDSCGYYNGEEVIKGVDKEKKWMDFISTNGIKSGNGKNNIFIAHTRKASVGAVSERNAHPWNIKDEFFMVHNGTLSNHFDICKNYNIDTIPIYTDSEALATLLHKEGHKVLAEYKGFAAIAYHDVKEPNIVRIYHGASKELEFDKNLTEERPLFIMQGPEGCYFSSMLEPLVFISKGLAGYEPPAKLPHNWVIAIKDGVYTGKGHPISREEMNVKKYYGDTYYAGYKGPAWNRSNTGASAVRKVLGNDIKDIETEPKPDVTRDHVYYWKNRYWLDDEMITGRRIIDRNGKVHPFVDTTTDGLKKKTYFFFRGVLLNDEKDYNKLRKELENPNSQITSSLTDENQNFARLISPYAFYPVTNIDSEAAKLAFGRNSFYAEGKTFNQSYTPKWSGRNYCFRVGELVSIKGLPSSFTNFNVSTPQSVAASESETLIKAVLKRLSTEYKDVKQMEDKLFGFTYKALYLYVAEVLEHCGGITNPTQAQVAEGVRELMLDALNEKCPIIDLMTHGIFEVEQYVKDAFEGDVSLTQSKASQGIEDELWEAMEEADDKKKASTLAASLALEFPDFRAD